MLIRSLLYRNLLWKQILPELQDGHKHSAPYAEQWLLRRGAFGSIFSPELFGD